MRTFPGGGRGNDSGISFDNGFFFPGQRDTSDDQRGDEVGAGKSSRIPGLVVTVPCHEWGTQEGSERRSGEMTSLLWACEVLVDHVGAVLESGAQGRGVAWGQS